MIIKVCGMRNADNIRQVDAIQGVNWMGFIFWPHSSRYVSERPTYLPTHAKRVGVFVNEDIEQVKRIADDYALNLIQLHGHESPAYCRRLRSICRDSIATIKAFNIATIDDLTQTSAYTGVADYFLFDTKGKSVGGNGEKFDWDILQHYHGQTPFLLTGGIKPTDAEKVRAFHHPQFAGIDLNSGFETSPAMKDPALLSTFIDQITH